jgi:hypothetical protein
MKGEAEAVAPSVPADVAVMDWGRDKYDMSSSFKEA